MGTFSETKPMKELTKLCIHTGVGATLGAAANCSIGGIGVAAMGTAFSITLGPFIAIGAVGGSALYAVCWFVKRADRKKRAEDK